MQRLFGVIAVALISSGVAQAGLIDFEGFADGAQVTSVFTGDNDVLVARYDGTGALLWARTLGGTESDVAQSVVEDSAGRIVVTSSGGEQDTKSPRS